jgi:DNA mismatch repair protein MutS
MDQLQAALAEVDADSLSPREALELVYRLKRLAAGEG